MSVSVPNPAGSPRADDIGRVRHVYRPCAAVPALACNTEMSHSEGNSISRCQDCSNSHPKMQPPSRIKVVHVVVAGQIGGAERFLVSLATRPELSGADHCVALMTPNPKLHAFFADAGLRVHDRGPVRENPLAYLWRSWGPRDIAWLGRVLREEGADLIHAHTHGSLVLAARAGLRYGLPVLRTEHNVRHYLIRPVRCSGIGPCATPHGSPR